MVFSDTSGTGIDILAKKTQIQRYGETDYRFGFFDLQNLRSNLIKNCYF
jgi:hypothetical protein